MPRIDTIASIAEIRAELIGGPGQVLTIPMVHPAQARVVVPMIGRLPGGPRAAGPDMLMVTLTAQPVSPGLYRSTDGSLWAVPEAVLARRRKDRDWPAVYLERKGDGFVMRATFELRRPAGSPEARLLLSAATPIKVQFRAQNGALTIPFTQVEWRDPAGAAPEVIGQIIAQTSVDLNQVLPALQSDTSARLELTANLTHMLQVSAEQTISLIEQARGARWVGAQLVDEHNGTGDVQLPWNGSDGDANGFVRADGIALEDGQRYPQVLRTHPKWVDRGTIKGWLPWFLLPPGSRFEADVGFVQGAAKTDGVTFWVWIHDRMTGREQWKPVVKHFKRYDGRPARVTADLSRYGGQQISVELRVDSGPTSGQDWAAWAAPRIISPAQARPTTTTAALAAGGVKACFPPSIRANKPIYTQATGSGVDLDIDADWIQSPHGEIKETGVAGQLFILPDAYGLVFDSRQSLPAMSVLLVSVENSTETISDDYRVRVRLGLVPESSAQRLDRLRAWIRAQPLDAPYAELLVGGYDKAVFTPSELFADLGLRFGGSAGTERTIDARGFELVLDCSLQAYTLLTEALTTAAREVRIGEVELHIRPDGGGEVVEKRTLPVWLRLDRPVGHPLTVEAPQVAGGPVVIKNGSAVDVRAEAHPTLLVVDAMTGETTQAIPAQPHSLSLAPGARAELALAPERAEDKALAWNKIAISLWDVTVTLDSAAVLSRAHQLGSQSSINSRVRLWSYLLKHPDELREHFPKVYGVEVELRRGSGPPIKATLTLDQPETATEIGFSLIDLLNGLRPDLPSFEYRRRNLRADGLGPWTDWEAMVGREIQIVPVEG